MPDEVWLYYDWQTVVETWAVFQQHKILPNAGGWLDQDPLLVNHDWTVVAQIVSAWQMELEEAKK